MSKKLPFLIHEKIYENRVLQGTVIIPDISGFTQFVETTDLETGKAIVSKLLCAIIKSNTLNLQISEIEGDAILFYKYGDRIPAKEIFRQFCLMKEVFDKEVQFLEDEYELNIDLSLKLIAHYGALAQYNIGKFEKLYGKTVIEAHRLLKNKINSNTYVLLTNALLEDNKNAELRASRQFIENTFCEVYEGIKKICYTYFDFQYAPGNPCIV